MKSTRHLPRLEDDPNDAAPEPRAEMNGYESLTPPSGAENGELKRGGLRRVFKIGKRPLPERARPRAQQCSASKPPEIFGNHRS